MAAKLIYVLAAGHSGSTLLDLALGQHPAVCSTGELTFLPWQFSRDGEVCPKGEDKCTCGASFTKCGFWQQVLEEARPESKEKLLHRPEGFPMSFSGSIGHQVALGDRVLGMLRRHFVRTAGWRAYDKYNVERSSQLASNNWEMIDAIGAAADASFVVDSSKDPFRAFHLWKMRPQDLIPLVLLRDVESQIGSKHLEHRGVRKNIKCWINFYKDLVHPLIEYMGVSPRLIRYEDFCAAPEASLNQTMCDLELKYDGLLDEIRPRESHLVAGNPMRYKESFRISQRMAGALQLDAASRELIETARNLNPFIQSKD
jgi:hypothetical protein